MEIKDDKNQTKKGLRIYKKKSDSDFELPVLGIGTYGLGGEHEADYSKDEECINAIRAALDLGYTHIDTAEVYGNGHTEELIGKAIEGYDRDKIFITTKVFKTNLKHDDVIKSAKGSLNRMKIKHIDLYLVHSFNPEIPLEETIRAMNELIKKGWVKHIGVCNFSIAQLKEAQSYSKVKIGANQMKYNLWANTKPDLETFDYCQKNKIMIIAYKLFGRGKLLTEKIPLISAMVKKYKKTDAQIMVNWVVSKKNFVAIFTSMDKEHLKENIEGLNFHLDEKDIQKLDGALFK